MPLFFLNGSWDQPPTTSTLKRNLNPRRAGKPDSQASPTIEFWRSLVMLAIYRNSHGFLLSLPTKVQPPMYQLEYSMHLLVDNPRLNHSHTARLKGSMELSIMPVAYLELLSCSIFPQAAYLRGIKRRWIVMESSFFGRFFHGNTTQGKPYRWIGPSIMKQFVTSGIHKQCLIGVLHNQCLIGVLHCPPCWYSYLTQS